MSTERMGVRKFVDSKRPLDGIVELYRELSDKGYHSASIPIYSSRQKAEAFMWCQQNFKKHHWISFGNTFWFTNEDMAVEFKLRWL